MRDGEVYCLCWVLEMFVDQSKVWVSNNNKLFFNQCNITIENSSTLSEVSRLLFYFEGFLSLKTCFRGLTVSTVFNKSTSNGIQSLRLITNKLPLSICISPKGAFHGIGIGSIRKLGQKSLGQSRRLLFAQR